MSLAVEQKVKEDFVALLQMNMPIRLFIVVWLKRKTILRRIMVFGSRTVIRKPFSSTSKRKSHCWNLSGIII
jgi:hypothetical protein